MPIFTDNDVADSVGNAFLTAGHDLTRLRDHMANNSPDQIVEAACRAGGLVLVTHNYRDFRKIVREQNGVALTRAQANELCRIELACEQHLAARRVREEMDFIALAWARFLADPLTGMVVTIGAASVRFARGPEMTGRRRVFAKPEAA